MDLIKWRGSYETGIRSMDTQHQKLIELINQLYKVLREQEPSSSIEGVLLEMTTYADEHLRIEEGLLTTNWYPDLANHIAIHQTYRDRLTALTEESVRKSATAAQDTYTFLRQWWMEHIVTEDKKYGEFLKSKGVE